MLLKMTKVEIDWKDGKWVHINHSEIWLNHKLIQIIEERDGYTLIEFEGKCIAVAEDANTVATMISMMEE